jgi:hypothetical protein
MSFACNALPLEIETGTFRANCCKAKPSTGGAKMPVRMINRILLLMLGFVLLQSPAKAEDQLPQPGQPPAPENPRQYRAQGHLFGAPGAYVGYSESVAVIHIGVGGEGLVYRGFGLGAEAGVLWAVRGSDPLGLVSVNGSYHFSRRRKLCPFLTGGYSLIGGDGNRSLVNVGGGANWWIRNRTGIRLEFRDHVYADGSNRHILEGRIGFAFR